MAQIGAPGDALQSDVVIDETLTHCLAALIELNPVQGDTPLATNILVNSIQYFVDRENVTGLQYHVHVHHLLHRGREGDPQCRSLLLYREGTEPVEAAIILCNVAGSSVVFK